MESWPGCSDSVLLTLRLAMKDYDNILALFIVPLPRERRATDAQKYSSCGISVFGLASVPCRLPDYILGSAHRQREEMAEKTPQPPVTESSVPAETIRTRVRNILRASGHNIIKEKRDNGRLRDGAIIGRRPGWRAQIEPRRR